MTALRSTSLGVPLHSLASCPRMCEFPGMSPSWERLINILGSSYNNSNAHSIPFNPPAVHDIMGCLYTRSLFSPTQPIANSVTNLLGPPK